MGSSLLLTTGRGLFHFNLKGVEDMKNLNNNCQLDRDIKLESLNELYDEPLNDAQLQDASANLMDFFNVLIEIHQDNLKGGASC